MQSGGALRPARRRPHGGLRSVCALALCALLAGAPAEAKKEYSYEANPVRLGLAALREGRIAGAGLDVYWTEPPVGEPAPPEELFKMDNVILTPHLGSATYESRRKMAMMAAENAIAMINGERPRNLLNPEALERAAV